MKAGKNTVSSCRPHDFEFENSGTLCNIATNDDIVSQEVIDEESGEVYTQFKYKRYASSVELHNYDETVAALVHLKYSLDDEIALLKKGMINEMDEEYSVYIEYVDSCKEYAREVWQ